MKKVKKIFFTTIALSATGLIMKTVAVFFNVYVNEKIGTSGMGLFQLILSLYAFFKTLSSAGIGLASTRLCIESEGAEKFTVKKLFAFSLVPGILSFAILFGFSEKLAIAWIGSESAFIPIKILSVSLPFLSLSTCLNGYMTAKRKLPRYSVIQLLEQISRISVTVMVLTYIFTTPENALIGVTCGITASEIISFSLSLFSYLFDRRNYKSKDSVDSFSKKMLRIAIPDALGSYMRSALNTIEHLLIPKGIKKSGRDQNFALAEYGALQGLALPVILYPSSVFSVLSGLLVPEIAECSLKNNKKEINYIVNRVISFSVIFSFSVASFMLINSAKLSNAVYSTQDAAKFILILSPLIPVMYLDMTCDGMLKGLDEQLHVMRVNILDSFISVIMVFFLVPKMAISGYVLTIFIAEIINFLLSFGRLNKRTEIELNLFKNIITPCAASFISFRISDIICRKINIPTLELVLSATVGILIYYILLRISGSLSKEDSRWLKNLFKP